MFAFVLRIQEIVRKQGKDMDWLSKQLDIARPSLYSRLKTGKIKTLEDIANILNVPVHELIECPEGYAHFYHEGKWHGIRKL
jgi:lambda repressor-like predicted transcriptional regulator